MIDAHCHLTDKQYCDRNIEDLIKGLEMAVSNGTSIEDSKKAIEIAEKYPQVYATVGVHPEEILNFKFEIFNQLLNLSKSKKVVAVGEAALDYFEGITNEQKELQRKLFEMQIQLAKETGLPLVVHNRNADEEILDYLNDFPNGVQLHCFVEKEEYARQAIDRGWYLSFGGIITFKRSDYLRDIVKKAPLDLLLTETDAPYLAPEPVRGSVNEPRNVKIVAEVIASLKGISTESLGEITERNARKLFKKMYD